MPAKTQLLKSAVAALTNRLERFNSDDKAISRWSSFQSEPSPSSFPAVVRRTSASQTFASFL